MSERAILHSDLNCFFASVETVLNPDYRGKAIAVCGSTEDRHGIVVAKSESARRAVSPPAWSIGRRAAFVQSLL